MKKSILVLFLLNIIISCNAQVNKKDYIGEWIEVKYKKEEFVIIKCGYEGEMLKVSENSIFEHGTMEDSNYKIDNVKSNDKENILFTEKSEKAYFKFFWLDKEKGIAKWQIVDGDSKTDKYFVIKSKSKAIKSVNGTGAECITNVEVGDKVNDSFLLNNNIIFSVEDDKCISLKNKKEEMIFENCFERTIVKIRHISKEFIPLTFISGKYSMDIDFYKNNNQWISKSITYYDSALDGVIKNISVSLNDFKFDFIKNKFISKSTSSTSSSFDNISNKNNLIKLNIYEIANILKDNPISVKNITTYNDAAYYLIEEKNYNEARIILLDIVNFSPNRIVAYLNLGDAEWGFDEKSDAIKSYKKYIELMTSQGKDLKKIPQRVYDRIK